MTTIKVHRYPNGKGEPVYTVFVNGTPVTKALPEAEAMQNARQIFDESPSPALLGTWDYWTEQSETIEQK